jgi:hypothetical protein
MSINTLSTTAKRGKFEKVKEGLNGRVRKQKRSPRKRQKEMKTNALKKLHNTRPGGAPTKRNTALTNRQTNA